METKTKRILEIANYTPSDYNKLLVDSFIFWAGENTNNRRQWQVVISSKEIQKWFFQEYEKLENEFLSFYERHPQGTEKDNERLYARMVGKIYTIYPGVLLDEIKTKYRGIPVHNLN